jgi:hypothetical protein
LACPEEDNLLVFYYLKSGMTRVVGFGGSEWSYNRGNYCIFFSANYSSILIYSHFQFAAFMRRQWDEKPHLGYLSFMTPTPSWYECGISLP